MRHTMVLLLGLLLLVHSGAWAGNEVHGRVVILYGNVITLSSQQVENDSLWASLWEQDDIVLYFCGHRHYSSGTPVDISAEEDAHYGKMGRAWRQARNVVWEEHSQSPLSTQQQIDRFKELVRQSSECHSFGPSGVSSDGSGVATVYWKGVNNPDSTLEQCFNFPITDPHKEPKVSSGPPDFTATKESLRAELRKGVVLIWGDHYTYSTTRGASNLLRAIENVRLGSPVNRSVSSILSDDAAWADICEPAAPVR